MLPKNNHRNSGIDSTAAAPVLRLEDSVVGRKVFISDSCEPSVEAAADARLKQTDAQIQSTLDQASNQPAGAIDVGISEALSKAGPDTTN